MQVKIRFGMDTIDRTFPDGTTVGQAVNDPNVKAVLGHGDSIRVTLNGVEQCLTNLAPNGGTLVVETRANSKSN